MNTVEMEQISKLMGTAYVVSATILGLPDTQPRDDQAPEMARFVAQEKARIPDNVSEEEKAMMLTALVVLAGHTAAIREHMLNHS